jgi:hypothetical protein
MFMDFKEPEGMEEAFQRRTSLGAEVMRLQRLMGDKAKFVQMPKAEAAARRKDLADAREKVVLELNAVKDWIRRASNSKKHDRVTTLAELGGIESGVNLADKARRAFGEMWDYVRAVENEVVALRVENEGLRARVAELNGQHLATAPGSGVDEWRDND